MFGVTDLGLFILSGLILNITPGPDLLYIGSRSVGQGKKAGVVAALGIGTGCLVHVLAAAFGLSIVLFSSSLVFYALKYVGAAYLLYLGIKTVLSIRGTESDVVVALKEASPGKIFVQAILINVLNPKVALFFLAFLPQFVNPEAGDTSLVFLFLGLLFNVNGTVVNVIFAVTVSAVSARIKGTATIKRLLRLIAGSVFAAFGLRLAFDS